MGIFRKKENKEKELRYIIKEYYGDSVSLFAYNYAKNIYSIPEVRTAIEFMSDIFATIPIYHKKVDRKTGNTEYLDDDISYVLKTKPNKLQNGIQFWKSLISQLLLESNAFAEPIYDSSGKLQAIYPLSMKYFEFELTERCALVKFYDAPRGQLLKKHNLDDLVYLNRFSSLSGGKAVNLGLYETVMQALSNQILAFTNPKKVKAILQGVVGQTGNIKDRDKKGTMRDLQASFDQNVDGIAYVDPHLSITPVNWQENDVNRDLMSFVINVVYNYFKISESIINNKCTEIEREMFIANSINPLAQQIAQELTYKLFTENEIRQGHEIELDSFALSVSTLNTKTSFFNVSLRNGLINIDEAREYIGQPPLKNGLGKKYRVSADCVDLEIADRYQLGKVKENVVSTANADDIKIQQEENAGGTET